MTQQPPATPEQPAQQDQPSKPEQPPGGETGLASEPSQATAAGHSGSSATEPELPDQPAAAPPPPPPPAPAPAAPPKKRRVGLIVTLTVIATIAVVAVGGYLLLNLLREELPQVGDCMTDAPNPDDMDVVACDASNAVWSVIGNDGTWTRGDFDAAGQGEVCQSFPATQQALWVTNAPRVEPSTEGEVICLASIGGDGGDVTDQ